MSALLVRLWHSPTATTWGSLAIRLAAMLVVLPVVLMRFAPPEVALWQLFSTLFMLAMMLDFGLAPTFVRLLSFARGGATLVEMARMQRSAAAPARPANPAVAGSVLATSRWLYPRIATGVTVLLAVFGTVSLIKPVAQTQDMFAEWVAWSVVLGSTGLSLWGGGYSAALQGMEKIAEMRRWEMVTGFCQIVTSGIVLAFGGHLLALVSTYQAWAVLGAIRNRWLLRRLHPELFATLPAPYPEVIKVAWPAAWRSGFGVLMSQGIVQASGVVYSQLAPAAEVASYLLALRLVLIISQFCQAPFYSKLPRLAALQAEGKTADQVRIAQKGMQTSYWVFAMLSIAVLVGYWMILAIRRIDSVYFFNPMVFSLLSLGFFVERMGAMHIQLYSLTNHIIWHIATSVTGVLMILASTLLFRQVGVYAFPAALLMAYTLFYCPYSMSNSYKAYRLRFPEYEFSTSLAPAATLIFSASLLLLAIRI